MIQFTVYGVPQSRGSKNVWQGRAVDSNPRSVEWMRQVSQVAGEAHEGELLDGPVQLSVRLYFARPQSHYGTGRNQGTLKASAPQHHTQVPDLSKCVRAIEDALTGVVYRDDRQVVSYRELRKLWTTEQARAEVTVEPL